MESFRFRLNCVDHYQAAATDFDPQFQQRITASQKQKDVPQVPVIRAFGATESGQKVCAHIHGAFPYLYIEYDGSLEQNAVDIYIQSLRVSIDAALAVSYRRNAYDGKAVFVARITLVKGVPFYGYHVGYKFYMKIYIFNPLYMTRLTELLLQGAIMKRVFQPYEAHLQYILQWMSDYNLYGCAYIDCAKVRFRTPVPDYLELANEEHQWHDRSIRPEWISDPDSYPRQSHCSIEIDVRVEDIMNREEIKPRPIHQDFTERFAKLDTDEKVVASMASLWRDETLRRKRRMGLTDPSSSPFGPDVLVSMSADPRNADKGGWIHEDEFNEIIDDLVDKERENGAVDVNFDNFVKPIPGASRIQTALESVKDLYTETLQPLSASQVQSQSGVLDVQNDPAKIVVDTASIPHQDGYDSTYDSDNDDNLTQDVGFEGPYPPEDCLEDKHIDNDVNKTGENDEKHNDRQNIMEEVRAFQKDITDPSHNRSLEVTADSLGPSSNDSYAEVFNELNERGSQVGANQPEFPESAPKRRKLSSSHIHPNLKAPNMKANTQMASTTKRVAFQDPGDGFLNPSSQKDPDDLYWLSQSSQNSIKAHGSGGPSTLAFPTVKNPHDPDTTLRLSQRSEYSNSQKSHMTPASKLHGPRTDKASPVTPVTSWTPWSEKKQSNSTSSTSRSTDISTEAKKLASELRAGFPCHGSNEMLCFGRLPPSSELVVSTMIETGLPPVIYQDAYYADENDVPDKPREYAGREFKLESSTLPFLPDFDPTATALAFFGEKPPIVRDKVREEIEYNRRRKKCTLLNWEYAISPPSRAEVVEWLRQEKHQLTHGHPGDSAEVLHHEAAEAQPPPDLSQIEGPTQKNKHGFKYSQKERSTSVKHETQYMSIMSLEVHVNTRGNFVPNPEEDEIGCIFWCVQSDNSADKDYRIGILALSNEEGIAKKISRQVNVEVEYEEDELDLLNRMIDIVRHFDPDILTGFEVHNGSWGYLIERARVKYEFNLCDEFSRMKSLSHGRFGKEADRWGFQQTSTIRITGRHMINIWRAMRGELNLLQYTMENVVFHLLHKRIPHYPFNDLTKWYKSSRPRDLAKLLDYFLSRVQLDLEILEVNELVARTSEQARLLGVDFFSVFSRGSQFKVESLMFRIAKPENFILVSPSRKQVGQQNALECLPLVMEPQSAFYNSPLLVLDFQSLYPSVMIAYNYCYSTCLGRITSWRGQNKMGFTDYPRPPQLLELVREHINIAPNGLMYVKPEMRKSLLAKMLSEILETRVMVKSGMKVDKDDKTLQQLLNNRQLALKLIANVTYGYTSASFSGRMPCSEIADSIVQTGRETLEKAIALIHSVERWGAEVVYGDTDSLFVYLKGRTREQAVDIGEEIAKAVTDANPRPVKLKFEKVYHPCVLLAKKRYVGFKYESRSQKEPEFDAKGIETVRRDGTPAEQKIEEKALKILFRTADLSEVKRYFQNQCHKIMLGKVSIQDFLFAREVKLGTYSDKGPPPPGALIATKRMLEDPRSEPQYGERVPYVVVTGAPGARLVDRCVAPETLLKDEQLELDAEYYISKNLIPPLERIFNLVGANVRGWWDEMPKVQRVRSVSTFGVGGNENGPMKRTLENYMQSSSCIVCRAKLPRPPPSSLLSKQPLKEQPLPLCKVCLLAPARTLLKLRRKLQNQEQRAIRAEEVCRSCAALPFGDPVACDSRDCPVFYTRVKEVTALRRERGRLDGVVEKLEELGW
ncbi:hypothetical protein M501DRAFT_1057352 [Patellaria atrata CBS 101060]|uniref:DNA polymerase n=1 Tax=Patellaria atrata CBS 101060 TaxID=1346257 RepID=A0A9P4SC26_9PEZI|nr:hypothetical protein M501DRAFT_1057352 [Patellaria atrata CBS 101060]